MKRFGRALERERVSFLLISGQASVLYGAATFSEDVDIWVKPTPANWRRLLRALSKVGARIHKLTPPLQPALARRGHGFHFVLSGADDLPAYLDVMGRPPRVGAFRECQTRARTMDWAWGRVPVIGLEDLVRLKRTRRRIDYEVISRLVRVRVEDETSQGEPERSLLRWALRSTFSGDDLLWLLQRWPAARQLALALSRPALRLLRPRLEAKKRLPRQAPREVTLALETELARLQRADARYWTPIIAELRKLRQAGKLLREGTPVKKPGKLG